MVKKDEFLEKLASLCEEYKATFAYTIDDVGILIELDEVEIFEDFLFLHPADVLRSKIGA